MSCLSTGLSRKARQHEPDGDNRLSGHERHLANAQDHPHYEGGTYGDIFRIVGEKPLRWVQQTDFQNDEAVGYLADRLNKLGVEDELFRAGATPGATVVIGEGDGIVFDWEPSISSNAELMTAPRGTDPRLLRDTRRTTSERREKYHDMMDAKAEARAELEAERIAERAGTAEDAE